MRFDEVAFMTGLSVRRMSVLSAAALLVVIDAAGVAAGVPTPGSGGALNAVACTSSSNCWAVGQYTPSGAQGALTEALHWNGSSWSKVTTPNPSGSSFNVLYGVTCTSATNCWAVGSSNLALRWNGKSWSKVATPSSPGVSQLEAVACTSATNCWAVGAGGTNGGAVALNEALHWNGKSWSKVATPNPGGTTSVDDNYLYGVTCASATNCWAVGEYGGGSSGNATEALRWNGKSWSQVPTPSPGGTTSSDGNQLRAVTCTSTSNCWAIGYYYTSNGGPLNDALRWNGTSWSKVSTPNPGGTAGNDVNILSSVACTTSTNCWAVGEYGNVSNAGISPGLNQALRWNGKSWSKVSTPNPSGTASNDRNYLNGVTCTAATNCWAVGSHGTGPPNGKTVNEALRWKSSAWVNS